MSSDNYDLLIVGGTAGGLSVAISSLRSGLPLVRIVEESHSVTFPELVGENELDVGYGESVLGVDVDESTIVVTTSKQEYRTRACLVADRRPLPDWRPSIAVTRSDRIHVDRVPDHIEDDDVLVVGYTDHAVELTALVAAAGARVVLAAGGMDPSRLSPAGDNILRRLERERRVTILYRSVPDQISDVDGYPMAFFGDRRTPDLQFDHVVFASLRETLRPPDVGLSTGATKSRLVWFLGEPGDDDPAPTAPGLASGAGHGRGVLSRARRRHAHTGRGPTAAPHERHRGAS